MSTAPQRKYTIAEYVALEERAEIKHEFYRGEIFAMAGGSHSHARIAANLMRLLGNQLQGTSCYVLGSDMRVAVSNMEFETYPDAIAICGEAQFDPADRNALVNPMVIVEVLSPSTERYDRTTKFRFYRKIDSLRQYVLVSQDEPRVETFVRKQDDEWTFGDAVGLESTFQFPAIHCELPLAAVYEGIKLDPTALRLRQSTND